MAFLVFVLSFLPGLFYMWIVYRQDKYDPEPHGWVALTFFLGMVSTFPAIVVEWIVDGFIFPYSEGISTVDPFSILVGSFLVIGPVEEMFKFWAVLIVAANADVFDEPVDGLVYAGAAALGFASLENGLYCTQLGSSVYIPRALMAIPAHLLFAGFWGYGLSFWRFVRPGFLGFVVFAVMFVLAASMHGAYDAMLMSRNPLLILLVLALLVLLVLVNIGFFWHYRKVSPYRWSILPAGPRTMRRRAVKTRHMRGLSIGWVAGGTAIYLAVALFTLVILGALLVLHRGTGVLAQIDDGSLGWASVIAYMGLLLALIAGGFFLSGIVIGRLSRGKTIVEPAISAVLALSLIVILIPPSAGSWALVMLVAAAPAIFGLGCLGGWIGEKWQARSEQRARAASP